MIKWWIYKDIYKLNIRNFALKLLLLTFFYFDSSEENIIFISWLVGWLAGWLGFVCLFFKEITGIKMFSVVKHLHFMQVGFIHNLEDGGTKRIQRQLHCSETFCIPGGKPGHECITVLKLYEDCWVLYPLSPCHFENQGWQC